MRSPHRLRRFLLFMVAIVLLASLSLRADTAKPAVQENLGSLAFSRGHAAWPTPESLMTQLRSADDQVRMKALHLLGLGDKQVNQIPLDQVQLTYVALGVDSTQQAIISVQHGQMSYVAVGAPKAKEWERIATFSCWCKYEPKGALNQFVGLNLASGSSSTDHPEHFELVLHASGGGTGVYAQDEAHFRVREGELRPVISFISWYELCPPRARETDPFTCTLEARWFIQRSAVWGRVGDFLIEARGGWAYVPEAEANDTERISGLKNRHLRHASCREYRWNDSKFRYDPVGLARSCLTRTK